MKRLISLILLSGAFLGGYYLGRLPNSPDLIGWGQSAVLRSAEVCREVIATLEDWNGDSTADAQPVGHHRR